MINQKFEIVKDKDLYKCEIEARSKIKDYNDRGYRCISHSLSVAKTVELGMPNLWVISLLFEFKHRE